MVQYLGLEGTNGSAVRQDRTRGGKEKENAQLPPTIASRLLAPTCFVFPVIRS